MNSRFVLKDIVRIDIKGRHNFVQNGYAGFVRSIFVT